VRQFDPTPIENLDPATQVIAVRAQGLREQNALLAGKIESMGGGVDVNTARIEHLIGHLVHLGILSEHAMWEIALDWEESLRPQLKSILDAAGKRIAELNAAAAREAAKPRLFIPGK
jgi:hypothetical protein